VEPVNTLTAKPLLEYMLASEGMEAPALVFAKAWPIYCRFLAVPDQDGNVLGSYQAAIARENPEYAEVTVRLVRELTDGAAGVGDLTRSVFVQFIYEGPLLDVVDEECWSNDFPDLEAFRQAVEALPTFGLASVQACTDGSLVVEERDPDKGVA